MIREQNVILKIAFIEVIPVILLKFFRPIPNILTSTAMFAFGVKFRLTASSLRHTNSTKTYTRNGINLSVLRDVIIV